MNLLYLAKITERLPILPPFVPSDHLGRVGNIDFGEIFDMPTLRKGLQMPVLEWHEVKNQNSSETDELGCWNVWESVQYRDHRPRGSAVIDSLALGMDPTYMILTEELIYSVRYIIYQNSGLGQSHSQL